MALTINGELPENLEGYELFHLSHIDLDGYGSQFITSQLPAFNEVHYYNANYEELLSVFVEMSELARRSESKAPVLFLITDLGLSEEEATHIQGGVELFGKTTGRDAALLTLDHHKTTIEASEKFPWIKLDLSCSATLATYNAFKSLMDECIRESLEHFAKVVNVQDMWLEDDAFFRRAVLLSNEIMDGARIFPRSIATDRWDYLSHIIYSTNLLIMEGATTRQIELGMLHIKEKFLEKRLDNHIVSQHDLPIRDLLNRHIYECLSGSNVVPEVEVNSKMGLFFYDYPPGIFQQVSHYWLREDPNFAFAVRVAPNGGISFRANNMIDVSEIAKKHFGGGGHANAAGGRMELEQSFVDTDDALNAFKSAISSVDNTALAV